MGLLVSAILTFFLASAGLAQSNGHVAVKLPFPAGETLTYEAKIRRILPTIAVADLIFTVRDVNDKGEITLTAEARSKGTLLKMFRYSFLQQVESQVAPQFHVMRTVKHDVQKDRVRDSIAAFDYEAKRVTYRETDPNEPLKAPRMIASELIEPTQDLLAGLYRLRTMALEPGKAIMLSVSDSGLVYKIPVRVIRREVQKTVLGRIQCIRVEPEVFGPGRLIEREGSMTIWFTADRRLIPVRSVANTPYGRIDIRLKSTANLAPQ